MRTTVRKSSKRPMSITARALRKGSIRAGPASKPSPRRMRPKCNQFRVSVESIGARLSERGAREQLSRSCTAQPLEVFLVLDDRAECRLHGGFIELGLSQRDQRPRPVERFGDPGQLIEVEPAHAADETADLAGQPTRNARDAG